MEDKKYISKLIEMQQGFDIDKYRDINIKDSHTPFEGTPRKHPYDNSYLILFTDPFSHNKCYYEFSINSIGTIEEIGTISSEDGRNTYKVRLWIKK
jgi:inorganic pyrophosphatase